MPGRPNSWSSATRCWQYIKVRAPNPIPEVMPILAGLGSPQEMAHIDEKWHTENFMWGNARTRRKDFWTKEIEEKWNGSLETARKRLISCYNCPMKCGAIISAPGTATYMMKCFSKLTYTMAAFVDDLDFGFKIAQKATEYGVDGFSTPQIMAFGFELKEAGILTDADFAGCPSDNEGKFYWLLDRIVRREGIGDVLANGTYWAAKQIGKGAEAYAHNNIKKHEQLPLKLGMLNPIYFLMYCHRREDQHHPDRREVPPGAFLHRWSREKRLSRTGSRSPTTSSSSTSWTGNARGTLDSLSTRRSKQSARSWTGRRRCTTSTTRSGCAPGCRPSP